MESTNLHHHHHHQQQQQHQHQHQHHQLQDQLIGSSPPLASPSCYGLGTTTHAWTPILNPSNFSPTSNGISTNSRDSRQQNDYLVPSLNSSVIQDLGFQWANGNFTTTQSTSHDLHLARKGDLPEDHYPKFTEMIHSNTTSSSSIEDFHLQQQATSYAKNEQRDLNDLSEKLLLRNFSGCQINGIQLPAGEFYSGGGGGATVAPPSRGNFSQIFPTINISNLNQSSSAISSSMDMNMQALDLFTSGRFSGCLNQVSHDNLGLYKDSLSYGVGHMHQQSSHNRPSNSPTSKISPFTSGITETKRPSSHLEPKGPPAAQKKSRSDSRSSCPPFKVRKEKLGDRIAALQQLVAPFGKTDTASVLMEAIGYIKFLQNQTLSVPYMKSSRNKTSRTIRGGQGSAEDGNEEPKRDLRSRGLCLLPLSCLSYVTDGGGGVWPPANFSTGI
ncbi:hypothetical protein CsSME_00013634 [Camellia sinensis var. sinensis]